MTEIIVALDFDDVCDAANIARQINATWYKIGLELIYSPGGLNWAKNLRQANKHVFLDAKLSDIPTTVERATRAICKHVNPHIITIHKEIEAALRGCEPHITLAHVPSFTSDKETDGPYHTPAHAVVCRNSAVDWYKTKNKITIVPGYRPVGHSANDHQETFTKTNADYVIVGRPITRAKDPKSAYLKILEEFT